MTGIVSIPFRLVTAAVRRKVDLRCQTSALRAAAAANSCIRDVGTRFPATIVDGELLAMMSVQFRELLHQGGRSVVSPYTQSARARFSDTLPLDASRRPLTAVQTENRVSVDWGTTGATSNQVRSAGPAHSSANRPEIASPARTVNDSSQQPHWAGQTTEQAQHANWPIVAAQSAPVRRAEPGGIMARQLREYWDLEQENLSARAASESQRASQPPAKTAPSSVQPGASSDSTQFERQNHIAGQLRAFAYGQSAVSLPEKSGWPSDVESSSQGRSLRESSIASQAVERTSDFAERLASLLRQQATLHGIALP